MQVCVPIMKDREWFIELKTLELILVARLLLSSNGTRTLRGTKDPIVETMFANNLEKEIDGFRCWVTNAHIRADVLLYS